MMWAKILFLCIAIIAVNAYSEKSDLKNFKQIGLFEWKSLSEQNSYVSHYYLWQSSLKNWYEASEECQKIGGELTKLETKAEQDYVLNALPPGCLDHLDPYNSFIFVGGLKKSSDKWYWSGSDKPINYKIDWAPGEPNNLGNDENCLNIYRVETLEKFGLNDDPCSRKSGLFMCEKQEIADKDPKIDVRGNENESETMTVDEPK